MGCASDKSCHLTCENQNTSIVCPLVCNLNGCQCPDGTVIDEDKNQCVEPTECPGIYPLTLQSKMHDSLVAFSTVGILNCKKKKMFLLPFPSLNQPF